MTVYVIKIKTNRLSQGRVLSIKKPVILLLDIESDMQKSRSYPNKTKEVRRFPCVFQLIINSLIVSSIFRFVSVLSSVS